MQQGFAIGDRILGLSGDTHPDWSVAHAVLQSYQIIGASAAGKLHLAKGTPRDDAFAIRSYGPWLAVGVSDGVGSRPLSRYGATYVAEALASLLLRSFVPPLQDELKASEGASPSSKTSNSPLPHEKSNLDLPGMKTIQKEAQNNLESPEAKTSYKKYRDETIKEAWEDTLNLLSQKMREGGSEKNSNSTHLQQAASVALWSNNNSVIGPENEPSNEGDSNDLDGQENEPSNEDDSNALNEQENTSDEDDSNALSDENEPGKEDNINALDDKNKPVNEDDGNDLEEKENSSNEADSKALDAQKQPLNEDESNASSKTRGQLEKNEEEQKDNCDSENKSDLEEKMRQAFKEVHKSLSGHATYLGVDLKDLGCTALGLLLNVETGEIAVGQVGDGVILGLTAQKEIEYLVEAENTGDSQSTYTINRSEFEQHLKVKSKSLSYRDFQSLFVMTDGVSEDVIYSEPSALNEWGQAIDNNLRNSANLAESSAGMLNWLVTYHIPGSWDDRTLIVITKN